MGTKDLTEKILEDYNDVFADIVNVLLFNGEEKVKPNCLQNSLVHSQYKADDNILHEQERDVAKIWKECNIELALYGLENQTKVEKLMPLRVMGYEGASYRSQFQNKPSKIIPVITLVLYFGNKHWNQPKTLKELMDIPDGLEEYVNDCKIHVFEIAWLTDEQINKFKSDFKIVAEFFVNKRKNPDYIPDNKDTITHVDEILKLFSVMTGDMKYVQIDSERVKNMCDVAERLTEKGKIEERRLLVTNMLKNNMSPEEIAKMCEINLEEIIGIQKNC